MKESILFLLGFLIAVTILCLAVRFLSLQEGPSKRTIYFFSACSFALACHGLVASL
ncbi:MAG: hypothetical protein WCW00_03045 [Candidatus Paceibacterota bacterium]